MPQSWGDRTFGNLIRAIEIPGASSRARGLQSEATADLILQAATLPAAA